MARTKVSDIEVDLGGVEKRLDAVVDGMKDLNDQTKDMGTNIEAGAKATKTLANGFKGVGLALKSAGIGLFLEAFKLLKDLFMQNEQVAAAFAGAMQFLTSLFNDLVRFLVDNVVPVFQSIFDDPLGSLEKLGEAIKNNIIERFNSALEVAGHLGTALLKLFQGDFQGAFDSAKEAGSEMIDVLTGVDNTIEKVGEIATKAGDVIVKAFKKAGEAAESAFNLSLAKRDLIDLEANARKLMLQYQKEAEIQRQIRDDVTKSVDERIKANDELGKILEKQMQEEIKVANARLDIARATSQLNENDLDALAEVRAMEIEILDIEERITGMKSEQLMNQKSLNQEQAQMVQAAAEADAEVLAIRRATEAELTENIFERMALEAEAARLQYEAERELQILRSQNASLSVAEREDALNQIKIMDEKYRSDTMKRDRAATEAKQALASSALGAIKGLLEEGSGLAKGVAAAEVIWNTSVAVMKAFGQGGIFGFASAGVIAATGLAQLQKILSTNPENAASGGGVGDPGAGGVPQPPQFSVAGGFGNPNQQIEAVVNSPVRAYVVTKEVSTGQAVDRNTIRNAAFS